MRFNFHIFGLNLKKRKHAAKQQQQQSIFRHQTNFSLITPTQREKEQADTEIVLLCVLFSPLVFSPNTDILCLCEWLVWLACWSNKFKTKPEDETKPKESQEEQIFTQTICFAFVRYCWLHFAKKNQQTRAEKIKNEKFVLHRLTAQRLRQKPRPMQRRKKNHNKIIRKLRKKHA